MSTRGIRVGDKLFGVSRLTLALLMAASCAGLVLVLLGTGRYGAAVSPDSAMYVAASKSLLAGNGYLGYDGHPFMNWPPLYPTLLAFGTALGMDVMQAGRILNAIAYGLVALLSGWLFHSRVRDRRLAWLGYLFVLFSWPLMQIAMKIWSDLVFVFLVLLSIVYAPVAIQRPTWTRILLFASLVALSTMQRYAGVSLVAVGVLLFLLFPKHVRLRKRLWYTIGFLCIATGPLLLWLLRNYLISSTLTGGRGLSKPIAISDALAGFAGTLTTWILPPFFPSWLGYLFGAVLVAAACLWFFVHASRTETSDRVQVRLMVMFAVAYAALVIGSSAANAANSPDNRLLAPLYVPFVFLLIHGLERGTDRPAWSASRSGSGRLIVIGLSVVWLLYAAASVGTYVYVRVSYNTNAWSQSEMAQWLKHNPPGGRLYSNQPWVVYLATGAETRRLQTEDPPEYLSRGSEPHDQPCHIVWFDGGDRGQDHVASLLADVYQRLPDDPAGLDTGTFVGSLLDFMRRGGVGSRTPSSGTTAGEQATTSMSLGESAQLVRTFEDGSLYVFTRQAPANR